MALRDLFEPTPLAAAEAPPPVDPKADLGRKLREYDERHAMLLVREAPRIGASASADPSLRRYLEASGRAYRAPTGRLVFATDHFLLDAATEMRRERATVVVNFGRPVVQSSSRSGRGPRVFSYVGRFLFNDVEPHAVAEWTDAWERYLRASRALYAVERAERAVPLVAELRWRDRFRRGYLVRQSIDTDALNPQTAAVSFDMFVVDEGSLPQDAPTAPSPTPAFRAERPRSPLEPRDGAPA